MQRGSKTCGGKHNVSSQVEQERENRASREDVLSRNMAFYVSSIAHVTKKRTH